jgi:hypothetical protein
MQAYTGRIIWTGERELRFDTFRAENLAEVIQQSRRFAIMPGLEEPK